MASFVKSGARLLENVCEIFVINLSLINPQMMFMYYDDVLYVTKKLNNSIFQKKSEIMHQEIHTIFGPFRSL